MEGKAELIVQLEKSSPEFRVGFLISSVDIFDFLLTLDFFTEFDCILYNKRKYFLRGKKSKTLELKSSLQNLGTMFLIVGPTQIIPSRSEKLIQCEVREAYQEATGLWVAQSLLKDSEGIRWVQFLNIQDEDIPVTWKKRNFSNKFFHFKQENQLEFSLNVSTWKNA